jgi:predicted nucleic acid-binding protein
MTVVDASVVVDALLEIDRSPAARAELRRHDVLSAPQMVLAEVASALRSRVLRGDSEANVAAVDLARAAEMPFDVHGIEPLLPRVWELRHVLSVYDAWYVALAEALEVDLVTTDERLQRAPGLRCTVRPPAAA